jgi:hypothetical protein
MSLVAGVLPVVSPAIESKLARDYAVNHKKTLQAGEATDPGT